MEEFVRLLEEHLDYIRHEIVEDTIYIYVKSNREEPACPYCGTPPLPESIVFTNVVFKIFPSWERKQRLSWKTEKCSV